MNTLREDLKKILIHESDSYQIDAILALFTKHNQEVVEGLKKLEVDEEASWDYKIGFIEAIDKAISILTEGDKEEK